MHGSLSNYNVVIDIDESIHINGVSLLVKQTKKGFKIDQDNLSNFIITFKSVIFNSH